MSKRAVAAAIIKVMVKELLTLSIEATAADCDDSFFDFDAVARAIDKNSDIRVRDNQVRLQLRVHLVSSPHLGEAEACPQSLTWILFELFLQ